MSGKILVVEDETDIRLFYDLLLDEYEIVEMEMKNLSSMLSEDFWEKEEYDAIILDLNLPEITGQEILNFILDNNIKAPGILVASASVPAVAEVKAKYPNIQVIEKPFSPSEFSNKIKSIINDSK